MAVKKATSNTTKSNSTKPATASNTNSANSATTSTSTPPDCLLECWIVAFGNTTSATYTNCIANCHQNIPVGSTQPGSIIPSTVTGSGPGTFQDVAIRGALIIVGIILMMIGVTRMFGGNKQMNVQLQTPERPHRFGGAPPPPPPPVRAEVRRLPPIETRTQSGPPSYEARQEDIADMRRGK
jgi:hypothetical protein